MNENAPTDTAEAYPPPGTTGIVAAEVLDLLPVGTVVQNAGACEWTRGVHGWFGAHPSWATSADLVEHGPLTVVSVPGQTTLTIPGGPKMIREALCVAEGATLRNVNEQNRHWVREVLGALIQECDRHRPLGPDGGHGNRHTATCGCDDVSEADATPVHVGGGVNAEDCPARSAALAPLPYPWICPGPTKAEEKIDEA